LQARSLFHAIFLGFGAFGNVLRALFDIHVTCAARTHAPARVLDVDAMFHREFEQAFASRAHELPLLDRLARQTLGVFEKKRHRNNIRAMRAIRVLEVHCRR
jgi:hypothetical protein